MYDLQLHSEGHALVERRLVGLHDSGPEVLLQAGQEQLVFEKSFGVADSLHLDGPGVGFSDGVRGDPLVVVEVVRSTFTHPLVGVYDAEIVVMRPLALTLHQLM